MCRNQLKKIERNWNSATNNRRALRANKLISKQNVFEHREQQNFEGNVMPVIDQKRITRML